MQSKGASEDYHTKSRNVSDDALDNIRGPSTLLFTLRGVPHLLIMNTAFKVMN
jgi:hypothetical protein